MTNTQSDDNSVAHATAIPQAQKVRLTDEGLETPEHLIGATGVVRVEVPGLQMEFSFVGDGVPEYSDLTVFPQTGKTDDPTVPERHMKIDGKLYEIVDDRDLNECPECGSDTVDATGDPPKCYDCDAELEDEA